MEIIDDVVLSDIPAREIACWRVKVERIHDALDQEAAGAHGIGRDVTVNKLEQKSRKIDDWRSLPEYPHAVNLELKTHGLNPGRVMDAIALHRVKLGGTTRERREILSRQLYLDGLARLGAVHTHEDVLILPDATAYAALCFHRGNIREHVDRALYENWEEIDLATAALAKLVPGLRRVWTTGISQRDPSEPFLETRYHYSFQMDPEELAAIDVPTQREAWWHELNRDMRIIEQASDSL